jgi:hypothetical protein
MPLKLLGTISSSVQKASTAFESIATATGTGSSATITFNSIPGTYQHLQIRGIARDATGTNTANTFYIRFNSDSGANYTQHLLRGNGTAADAIGSTSLTGIQGSSQMVGNSVAADILAANIIDILDYASTTKNKTVRTFNGANWNATSTNQRVVLGSGVWLNTSAITRIDLVVTDGKSFSTDSTFALYGIKGA